MAVALPGLHQAEVRAEPVLHHIHLAAELARLLAFRHLGTITGGREEGRDARAARAAAFGQGALRDQVHLQFPGQHLPLELLVLAHVAADHLADLPRPQQQPQPEVVNACIVADAGETLHAPAHQCGDQVLGDAAQTEATYHQGHAIGDALERGVSATDRFVHGPNVNGPGEAGAVSGSP